MKRLHTTICLRKRSISLNWLKSNSASKQRSQKHLQSFQRRLEKVWRPQLSVVHKIKAFLGIKGGKIRMWVELVRRFWSFKCDHQVASCAILPTIRSLILKSQRKLRRITNRRRKMTTKRKLLCISFKKFLSTFMRAKWKKRREATSIHYSFSRWEPHHSITQGRLRTEARTMKKSCNKCSKTNLERVFNQRPTLLSLLQLRCNYK